MKLQAACLKLAPIKTGEAVITEGFKLTAKHVIHTADPVWHGGKRGEGELLRNCYINSLELAKSRGLESIAFPLISSGTFGYPKDEALRVATTAIHDFLRDNEMDVYLVVFDKAAFALSEKRYANIQSYIDDNYAKQFTTQSRKFFDRPESLPDVFSENRRSDEGDVTFVTLALRVPPPDEDFKPGKDFIDAVKKATVSAPAPKPKLDDIIINLDESFSQTLLRLIDEKQKTAAAFAIALELTLDETGALLKKAGYALSHSQKFDVIIEYFIREGNYDIFEINEALFAFDQQILGG